MKLRSLILLFLLVFGLTPLILAVMINLPLVLDRTALFYQKAYLQNLRADFRDLDQHLASRNEMIRLLAKLPEPGLILGEAGDENQTDLARARYTAWINQILGDQRDIIQILFLGPDGGERFWLTRDPKNGHWSPSAEPPQAPSGKFVDAGLRLQPGAVLVSRIRVDTGASSANPRQLMTLDLIGVIDRKMIYDLAEAILSADVPAVLDVLDDIYDRGHDMKKLYADLLEHFRNLLVATLGSKVDKLIDLPSAEIGQLVKQAKLISASVLNQTFDLLFREEAAIRLSPQPKLALEMTLIRLLQAGPALPIDILIDKLDDLRQEMLSSGQRQEIAPTPPKSPNTDAPAPIRTRMQPPSGTSKGQPEKAEGGSETVATASRPAGNLADRWTHIIETIARKNPSLAANLAKCQVKKSADQLLEIEVPGNGFTLNMIQREKNMAVLKQVCADILGSRHELQFTAGSSMEDKNKKKKMDNQLKQKAISHPLVADAIEIFDGKLIDVKIL